MKNKPTTCGGIVNKPNKEIYELKSALQTLLELHKSLVEDESCDHESGICWCRDFDAIELAEKVLKNV